MSPTVSCSSTDERINDLAYNVCITELRPEKLQATINKWYPDGVNCRYAVLCETIISHLAETLKEAFSKDADLSQKMEDATLARRAQRYVASAENLTRIQERLSAIGYHEDSPQPISANTWWKLF